MEGGCVTQKKRNDEYARLTAMTDHDRANISVELLISFLVRRRQVLLVGIDDEHGEQAGKGDPKQAQFTGGKPEAGKGRGCSAGHVIGLRQSGAAVKLSNKGSSTAMQVPLSIHLSH